MRIETKVVGAVVADSREQKATTPPATSSSKQPVSSVVSLSPAATKASASEDTIDPAMRTRLDQIRDAIKHNNYPIDLDKLASKIFEDDKLRGQS